ncbi:Dihydroorotase [Beijerinckiaceae bacterium RH AL1]|nr:dihydroorotase [Beijerinckiaceae bacterium]VVB46307.1 Dihydroorotase [Beijerinckiaceae bacterium RH CH11]VVB46392.1 Dihydroorotase [Beijerinckiaceae bacterium RH AL8]VVC55308.1 Dihydroorotase [Beijerinckiaceae bacterium RH AL1]
MTFSAHPHGSLALVNTRLVDPVAGTETRGGVLVEQGFIRQVGPNVTASSLPAGVRTIDCRGDVVAPGLVDMHAFVGEPGAEYRETIATATAAAAAGGVTSILSLPDTNPPVDEAAVVDFLMRRARDTGRVRILPCAALTKGLRGEDIAEIGLLLQAGAIAFSDGSRSIANARILRRAMVYARDFDALVIHFAEDHDLAADGVMNEGAFASRLGLLGIPHAAETIILERDMRLVALTGARYHAACVTTAESLAIIAKAKADGLPVTCATSINHLTLNENDIGDYRTFLKLKPPLRREEDRLALVEAVASGLIDAIVSDHDPQDVEVKRLPFTEAAPGAIGLETMLPAALRLVTAGHLGLPALMRALSAKPAEILRVPQGRLETGAPADLIRFDPEEPFVVDPAKLASRCKNTPFDQARLEGRVKLTLVAGEVVFEA